MGGGKRAGLHRADSRGLQRDISAADYIEEMHRKENIKKKSETFPDQI